MVKPFALLHLFHDIMIVAPWKQRWSFFWRRGGDYIFSLLNGCFLVSVYIIMNPAIFDVSFVFFPLLRISDSSVLEVYKSLQLQYA